MQVERLASLFRSGTHRFEVCAGAAFAALTTANTIAATFTIFDTHSRTTQYLTITAFFGSFLACLAMMLASRALINKLRALTQSTLAFVESYGGTVGVCGDGKDELDKLACALDIVRDLSRRAVINESNLNAAIENMVEGIIMISADGKVALHNQRLLAIFGLPPMNAVGLPRAEFNAMLVKSLDWPQSAQDYLQKQLAAVRADGQYRMFCVELPNDRVLRYSASMLVDGNVMSYIEDISEQRAAAASILRLAHYDTLTTLPNRTLFQERLNMALKSHAYDATVSVSLLVCDLDRFKMVNDTYGHPAGDELLRQATHRMLRQLRPNDTLARLGGDEFALIYTSEEDHVTLVSVAKRLIACLEQPFELCGHEVSVGMSVGIAKIPTHASTGDELMKQADLALYAAKRDGRNTYRVYEPSMSMLNEEFGGMEVALRKALDVGGLHLHYQPQVNLRTRRIVGFEALARWNHPERGVIPPSSFIPVAEKTGLVVPLGEWALRQACHDAMNWADDVTISVNVAPQQLRTEGFIGMVRNVLSMSGLVANRLELEITESAPLHDDEVILRILNELAGMGVRVSIDDFGSGNTGLNYLQKFRFDKLKIDQSFVRKLSDWKEAELIVRAIIELSSTLSVKTVAEGIETEQQAIMLRNMNCTIGQGYLFGRPVSIGVANELVTQRYSEQVEAG